VVSHGAKHCHERTHTHTNTHEGTNNMVPLAAMGREQGPVIIISSIISFFFTVIQLLQRPASPSLIPIV